MAENTYDENPITVLFKEEGKKAAKRRRGGGDNKELVDLGFDTKSAADWSEKKKQAYLKAAEEALKKSGVSLGGIRRDGLHGLEAAMAVTQRLLYPEKDIATGVPELETNSKGSRRKK